jgi:hypothetical protein
MISDAVREVLDYVAAEILDRIMPTVSGGSGGQAAPADPWASDGPSTALRATESRANPSPDGTTPAGGRGSVASAPERSAGSASYAQDAGQQSRGPAVLNVKGPNGMQTWTLNPPGGPNCDCDEPAALVHGPKAKGGFFNAYRCAKGSGDDWRNKCGFNKWT